MQLRASRFFAVIAAAGCAAGLMSCESDSTKTTGAQAAAAETKPLTVERKIEGKLRARVRAVDHAARLITLEDERAQAETFLVSPRVQRLHEVRPGDHVNMGYSATLLAELRPATPEEAANPISATQMSARADESSAPAGALARGVKVVTTVEAVDVPNMRVTLRGPLGDEVTVRGRNEDNMRRLKIGDTIVLTYTEAMAMDLEKANR